MGTSRCSYDIKVHSLMCSELMKLVNRASKTFADIEAAKPGSSSGIEALCSLSNAIDKANLLLQYCSESSKLYLALTGDVILSRCKKSRNLLHQSLSHIQNMVPVLLASQISRLIDDLRSTTFVLDPSEEEAGKVIRELLHRLDSDSIEEVALKAIQIAASRLHITSQKELLIEKRSIKKLLHKLGDNENVKRKILNFFLSLLNKHGKVILENVVIIHHEVNKKSEAKAEVEVEAEVQDCISIDIMNQPPEEFTCPLSLKLMYDPVVIASGHTFERMWIKKWFEEGHITCPKTGIQLTHFSLTPNTSMKDLILKWCAVNKVIIPNPTIQQPSYSLETSYNSIASLSSSLNDLSIPIDYYSNLSLGSLDVNEHEIDLYSLSKLHSLPWESQLTVVQNIENLLKSHDQDWEFIAYKDLIPPVIKFLKHAHELHDVKARRSGCVLWLAFIKKCRCVEFMSSDEYEVLALLIDIEVVNKEALLILEEVSCDELARYGIAASGAITSLLKILDENQTEEYHGHVLKILFNLSQDSSLLVYSDIIPKLVPFLQDRSGFSVTILKNLSVKEDARVCIAETEGCIASLVQLLDSDSKENQEHAVSILLSLCSQRYKYCQMVMEEGVIPALFTMTLNGNDKGKSMAMELLRLLRDEVEVEVEDTTSESYLDITSQPTNTSKPSSSSKSSKFFAIFSKPISLNSKRRR